MIKISNKIAYIFCANGNTLLYNYTNIYILLLFILLFFLPEVEEDISISFEMELRVVLVAETFFLLVYYIAEEKDNKKKKKICK